MSKKEIKRPNSANSFLLFVGLLLCLFAIPNTKAQSQSVPYEGVPGWEETKDERMKWFREARFGMFIHWGLYSAAGGAWKGEVYPQDYAEWIQTWAQIPSKEYAEVLKPQFTVEDFDANEWAALAKEAGMKYVIITSRHHDGFSIFNSQQPFSLDNPVTGGTNISPKGRDLYGELIEAFQAQGLKTGAYYSLLDWQHPDSDEGFQFNPKPESYEPDHEAYKAYLYQQIEELATNYKALDVLWPDFSSPDKEGETWGTQRILTDLLKWNPHIIVNNRFWNGLENKNGDIGTPEKYIPPTGLPGMDWEVSHTMNESYGYSDHDENWKSYDRMMRLFIETVSKGGNFLLNVGPDAKGRIPVQAVELLQKIGTWMSENSESIYGTTASPFSNTNWGYTTRKGEKLYLHLFDWPSSGIITLPLKNNIKKAYPLAGQNQELRINEKETEKEIHLSQKTTTVEGPEVIVVEIEGEPEVTESFIGAQNDGSLVLKADNAKFSEGSTLQQIGASHTNPNRPNAIGNWKNTDEVAYWQVKFPKPETYTLYLEYLPHPDKSGEVEIQVGNQILIQELEATDKPQKDFVKIEVGQLEVTQRDLGDADFKVTLKAKTIDGNELPEISSVQITP